MASEYIKNALTRLQNNITGGVRLSPPEKPTSPTSTLDHSRPDHLATPTMGDANGSGARPSTPLHNERRPGLTPSAKEDTNGGGVEPSTARLETSRAGFSSPTTEDTNGGGTNLPTTKATRPNFAPAITDGTNGSGAGPSPLRSETNRPDFASSTREDINGSGTGPSALLDEQVHSTTIPRKEPHLTVLAHRSEKSTGQPEDQRHNEAQKPQAQKPRTQPDRSDVNIGNSSATEQPRIVVDLPAASAGSEPGGVRNKSSGHLSKALCYCE